MMHSISDINWEFVDTTISAASDIVLGAATHLPEDSDAANVYFAGRTLCIDVRDDLGNRDVLTLCYEDEDIGWFTGGRRRLMPIKTIRLMQTLMDQCEVSYDKKDYL